MNPSNLLTEPPRISPSDIDLPPTEPIDITALIFGQENKNLPPR
ncbi:hypothetical protein [Cryobacterium sp. Y11]|nr:hypothetical protein [Cryobacterium sp. Y11]